MSKLKRIHLFSRLNPTAYKAMESATVLCKTRGNPYVELVHLINQIIMSENTDFHKIIDFFQLDTAKLSKDLIKSLDELPRGASSITDFSSAIEITVKEAWMTASLVFGKERIRTGHILAALKQTPELSNKLNDISVEFIKINGDILQTKFDEIVKDSIEISESGANAVRQAAADINRAVEDARWRARMKQQDDKNYANEFGNVVCNALVVKYQVDHGRSLMDYMPNDVRKDIHHIAAGHVKQVYKLLRSNTNEDILYEYMGNALQGVTYNQATQKYTYAGEWATINGNILDQMSIKSRNYTIGGAARQYGR